MGAHVTKAGFGKSDELTTEAVVLSDSERVGRNATRTLSGIRILFGAIFLFDGILKWILFQQGTMQGVIQGFGYGWLSSNWVAVGAAVALGETFGGLLLILGVFQRPAAAWSAAIMLGIWALSGFDGAYVQGSGWNFVGYTDPGGDLMLALIFVGLVFAPYAYGIASRLHLREKLPGSSIKARVLRALVC